MLYTERNLFEILLNQTKIRLCLPFSDWSGSKLKFVWIKINRKKINTIWFQVDQTWFRKYFSVHMFIYIPTRSGMLMEFGCSSWTWQFSRLLHFWIFCLTIQWLNKKLRNVATLKISIFVCFFKIACVSCNSNS